MCQPVRADTFYKKRIFRFFGNLSADCCVNYLPSFWKD